MNPIIGEPTAVMHKLAALYSAPVVAFVQSRLDMLGVLHGTDNVQWIQVEIADRRGDFALRIRAVDPALFVTEATSKTIE